VLRPVDAGCRVAFQLLDGLGVAPCKSLFGGTKLGGDAPPLLYIPPPPGKQEAGARGKEEKHLRHALESETRPKRARLDRRDEIGGETARREDEVERATLGKHAALAAEP
jgi:hypothetical protein